jgi:hypothetical protein
MGTTFENELRALVAQFTSPDTRPHIAEVLEEVLEEVLAEGYAQQAAGARRRRTG